MDWSRRTIIEFFVACLLIALPFVPFFHLLLEDNVAEIYFLGSQFNHSFQSNEIFGWYVLSNFCQIIITSCFFLFSTKGFRYFFLPLILHYWLLLIPAFFINLSYFDFAFSIEGVLSSLIILELLVYANHFFLLEIRFKIQSITIKDIIGEVVKKRNANLNSRINLVKSAKDKNTVAKQKLYQLYHLLNLTKIRNNEFTDKVRVVNTKFHMQDYFIGLILIICFAINFLDEIPFEEIGFISNVEYEAYAYGFIDFKIFIWYISWKVCMILTAMIWYVFNPYWWRNAILPGICLYLYQFYEIFQETPKIEDYNNFRIIPIVLVNLIIFFIISRVVSSRARIMDNLEYLNSEFEKGIESVALEN